MVYLTDEYDWWILDVIACAAAEDYFIGPWLPAMPESWVYFIQHGEGGPVKIGYSNKVVQRFVALQSGSPIQHYYLGNIPGARTLERDLHTRFARTHVRGEWFEPTEELLKYIEENRFKPETRWRGNEYVPPIGRSMRDLPPRGADIADPSTWPQAVSR